MKVLAIGHPRSGVVWERIYPYVGEQARGVWERYEIDRVREFYLRAPCNGCNGRCARRSARGGRRQRAPY